MYQALYRKWRPRDFDSVCGQGHVTDVLKYQVREGKVSHAYLFCGSRGTGKTSCAKILAQAVNCLDIQNGNPCNRCAACKSIREGLATDVIEMDAASNNGVDHVRDIRDEVVFTPAELKYRVYIIDEVHMLSPSAFNALLKTLEEPPSHVIFILATTELHKLPTTIVSRCQRYDFRRMPSSVLVERMKTIAAEEKIPLEDSGAYLIARMAAGGMRDAISLLELCAGNGSLINEESAAAILGAGNRNASFSVIKAISAKDYHEIYKRIADVVMSSGDLTVFWQELIDAYRDMMVVKTCEDAKEYLDVTENEYRTLKELAESFSMETLIYHSRLLEDTLPTLRLATIAKRSSAELTLTRMCEPRLSSESTALLSRIAKLEEEVNRLRFGIPSASEPSAAPTSSGEKEQTVKTPAVAEEPLSPTSKDVGKGTDTYHALTYWSRLIETLGERKASVAGFLSKTKAYYSKERGFLIQAASDFTVSIIERADVMLDIKSLICEMEGRSVLSEHFEVLSAGKTKSYSLVEELEEALNENK